MTLTQQDLTWMFQDPEWKQKFQLRPGFRRFSAILYNNSVLLDSVLAGTRSVLYNAYVCPILRRCL